MLVLEISERLPWSRSWLTQDNDVILLRVLAHGEGACYTSFNWVLGTQGTFILRDGKEGNLGATGQAR